MVEELVGVGVAGVMGIRLLDKLADATGVLYEPTRITRRAKAERQAAITQAEGKREVAIIEARSETDIDLIRHRAAQCLVSEQIMQQSNMEDITGKALQYLDSDATPQNMENDWITNFLDKGRIVSDDDVQELLSRILAGEANRPNSFSRKTVNLIADLDKHSVETFMTFCRFVLTVQDKVHPIIYDIRHEIYTKNGIDNKSVSLLKNLGLVDRPGTFFAAELGPFSLEVIVQYYGESRKLLSPKDKGNSLLMGNSIFTPSGLELYPICNTTGVDRFFDYLTNDVWNTKWVPV